MLVIPLTAAFWINCIATSGLHCYSPHVRLPSVCDYPGPDMGATGVLDEFVRVLLLHIF